MLAMVGALAGGTLYLLTRIASEGVLPERLALALLLWGGVFFTALMALAGPLSLPRAALRAAVQALAVAALATWASFRFDAPVGLTGGPIVPVSVLILTLIPLPFVLAEETVTWRDYPALFQAAWGIVMRSTVAWVFVAILWAVIYLSHLLLGLVGIDLIARILDVPPVPWLITGTAFGVAMAVALELADVVSAFLVLRLLRLLLPVVLAVVAVFLVAVAMQGLGRLAGGFSVGAVLLVMAGVAATLVTAAVDQTDVEATGNPLLRRATQALALILVLPAALAGWALAVRVQALGWTPDRLFAASAAALALGYGLLYTVAVLRGAGWMERVRQANVAMALALMALAALWLTPVLNPERIATASQLARMVGGGPIDPADLSRLDSWGRAGALGRQRLEALAASDPALADALARARATDQGTPAAPDATTLRAGLKRDLPVQPATETALRDRIIDLAAPDDLDAWSAACAARLPQGGQGCLMLVADFLPDLPGNEALLILHAAGGYLSYQGLGLAGDSLTVLQVDMSGGALPNFDSGEVMMQNLQSEAPRTRPVPRNEVILPEGGGLGLKP